VAKRLVAEMRPRRPSRRGPRARPPAGTCCPPRWAGRVRQADQAVAAGLVGQGVLPHEAVRRQPVLDQLPELHLAEGAAGLLVAEDLREAAHLRAQRLHVRPRGVDHRQPLVDLARGLLGLHRAVGEHAAQLLVLRATAPPAPPASRPGGRPSPAPVRPEPLVLRRERRGLIASSAPGRFRSGPPRLVFAGEQAAAAPLRGEAASCGGAASANCSSPADAPSTPKRSPRRAACRSCAVAPSASQLADSAAHAYRRRGRAATQHQHHRAGREQDQQPEGAGVVSQVRTPRQCRKCRIP
jgi:hypothetical protein